MANQEKKQSFGEKLLRTNVLYTLICIVIGFIVGAILLALAGISPAVAYGKLVDGVFSKPKYVVWSIVYATPIILTGLSVAFSFKTGVFNIGAEGQFVVGSLAAVCVGIFCPLPKPLHILLCLLAAAVAGGLWSMLVAILKVKRGINEVLSFIMFNWIAYYLSNYVVNIEAVHKTGEGEATKDILETASMTFKTGNAAVDKFLGGGASYSIVFAVLAAIIIAFILDKTTLGYKLKAVGFNKHAAQYGGINANKEILTALTISGMLAGLGGACQLMGMGNRISQFSSQEMYGFQGITVALIASSNPIGCIFAGLFYGAMKYGGTKLSLVNAPNEIVNIIMGTIIFFIAIAPALKKAILKTRGGK
ncbi:MAG: ABC transporter permease [Lachnospiraceae bacterium]|nr:ABC transporter permease [Lachnospiraceae bacterium]MBQ5375361.1 ABC transporter permease [Lachnospiraceae bacterium]MBR1848048.1 ABC transporter permease [Lachnospiraceae bacterium]MCR5321413.1 ABC transporter permease [Lachnospiraceae bacterium]